MTMKLTRRIDIVSKIETRLIQTFYRWFNTHSLGHIYSMDAKYGDKAILKH